MLKISCIYVLYMHKLHIRFAILTKIWNADAWNLQHFIIFTRSPTHLKPKYTLCYQRSLWYSYGQLETRCAPENFSPIGFKFWRLFFTPSLPYFHPMNTIFSPLCIKFTGTLPNIPFNSGEFRHRLTVMYSLRPITYYTWLTLLYKLKPKDALRSG